MRNLTNESFSIHENFERIVKNPNWLFIKNAAAERPTTQQGLGGLKSAFRGPQRQIQDKSYFQGILRTKMTEISTEITRLKNAIEKNRKEQQSLPTLENKVKELAAEITG